MRSASKLVVASGLFGSETHYWSCRGGLAGFCRFFDVTNQTVALFEKTPVYSSSMIAPLNLRDHLPLATARRACIPQEW